MGVDRRDVGLLMLRLGTGAVLVAHGSQKLFGWFGGSGLKGTADMMESVSYTPGRPSALASGLAEAGGGTLLALGLATPAAGAAATGNLASAAALHAPHGFFNQNGGLEYPAALGLVTASLAVTGPGRISLDHVIGHHLNRAWMVPAALGTVSAVAALVIGARERRIRAAQGGTDNAD